MKLIKSPLAHLNHGTQSTKPARHFHDGSGRTNLARDSSCGKKLYAFGVQINSGMSSTRGGKTYCDPMSHEFDANPASPTAAGQFSGKRLTPVMVSPGMRSRTDATVDSAKLQAMSEQLIKGAHMDRHTRMRYGVDPDLPTFTDLPSGIKERS